ncbi:hypothetical protein DH2020_044503 [Rehmannia glutinosa]|uniref:Uncharacterized protein n=1 Tax=Rehmannia glutinosa TaxID=99300 RepID=A0ABR0UIB5_REHGL
MLCSGRILTVSYAPTPFYSSHSRCYLHGKLKANLKWRSMASDADASSFAASVDSDSSAEKKFCIIEGPETVQDFATMELQEIQENIRSRRNKIFLQMEEVRRLRIQQRIKNTELGIVKEEQENELPNFPSFIPFLPPLLELKLGLGGTSYADFIHSMHLPDQLSQVDPIVASFSGGAVGVISALMVVEINNVKLQEHKRCKYCLGTGYLACARCSSTGSLVLIDPVSTSNNGNRPLSPPKAERCSNCSGSGKVLISFGNLWAMTVITLNDYNYINGLCICHVIGHVPYVSLHGNGYGK